MTQFIDRHGCRTPRGILQVCLLLLGLGAASVSKADDEPITEYLQILQSSGMADLALEYLDLLIESKRLPKSIEDRLDYFYGDAIFEASKIAVAERERELLDQALARFEKYRAEHSDTDESISARAKVAAIYIARAQRMLNTAKSAEKPEDAAKVRKQARELLEKARPELVSAIEQYAAAIAKAKKEGGRRAESRPKAKEGKGARKKLTRLERLESLLVGVEIARGMVEYHLGQAYDRGNAEEKKASDQQLRVALAEFDKIFQRDRSRRPGIANLALLKEGRVYQELGEYQTADDIYREILATEPEQVSQLSQAEFDVFAEARLSWCQTQNLWGKPERVLEEGFYSAPFWIERNERARRTPLGLGIQLEIAKAEIQTALTLPEKDVNRRRRIREAMRYLNDEVCAFKSPFQEEGFALRKQYAKEVRGAGGEMETFDELVFVGNTAMEAQQWTEAISAFEKCVEVAKKKKKDVPEDAEATARYYLAYCYFMAEDFAHCAEQAEIVARQSPPAKSAAAAGGIALKAYARLYDAASMETRDAIAAKLLALAEFMTSDQRFAHVSEADDARFILGRLYYNQKRYEDAAAVYGNVSDKSPNYPLALYQSGSTYYVVYILNLKAEPEKAEGALTKANDALLRATSAYEEQDKKSGQTSLGWAQTVFKRAEVAIRTGKGDEANKLCEPLVELAAKGEPPEIDKIAVPILVTAIEAAIATREMKRADAIVDVVLAANKGEQAGSDKITQVLLRLGAGFRQQISALEKEEKTKQAGEMKTLFKQFLGKIATRASQDFNSIRFVGESYFELGEAQLASETFAKALEVLEANPDVLPEDQRDKARMALRLRRFAALRAAEQYPEALQIINDLLAEHAAQKETFALAMEMEKGRLLDVWSEQDSSQAEAALSQWNSVATKLRSGKPKRIEYFEARLGVALAYRRMDEKAKAIQALRSTLTLSPDCGGPEMKKKFESLLAELGGATTAQES